MSASRIRTIAKWLLVLLLGAGAAVLVVGLLIWRYPLKATELTGRSLLRWSGFEETDARWRGGRVAYFRAGAGAPIVFVHGANDQAGGWVRVVPAFTRDHRVIVVDLAGHGDSDPREGPLAMRDLVDGLDAVLDQEVRGPATLVGNSLGGLLVLLRALHRPDTVAHVILVNGALDRGDGTHAAITLLPKTREEARHAMEALTSPKTPRMPAFVLDDLVRRAEVSPLSRLMAQPPGSFDGFFIDDRLGEVRVPVTLLWGADDRLLSIAYARRAAARLPQARIEILPDCGHVPQRECPGPLTARLRESLARVPAGGAPPAGD
jgi:pimeloyl-ACP methyl ester carboxylesterase